MSYLIGIDVSTTATKALVIDERGDVVASASDEYEFFTPRPLWAEQNPADWWRACVKVIRRVLEKIPAREIAGIGLTGQMHGLVLMDADGNVLRPCIMWNDQRTAKQCAEITERVGGAKNLLRLIGNPVLPGFTAPKILWVRENEPQAYARAAHVLLPKDYLRYKLTGAYATEVSDASGTALLDVAKRNWSDELLKAIEIPRAWLPDVFESSVVSAKISADAANETGLLQGTPVVGGGGDQAAQAVGTGIVQEGIVSATLGTSGVVFASSDSYRLEPNGLLHAFCHAVPNKWHLMGVMLSAAGSFRWFRDALGAGEMREARSENLDVYDILTREAARVDAGCEGLIFLPYLTGERTPHPDPHARGAFFGITLRHRKEHFTRAVLEGVAYGLRDSLELMRALGLNISQVRASGGGARSELWRQILADVFNSEIALVNITEGAAYGAALLAGVGAGVYASVEDACAQTIHVTDTVTQSENTKVYDDYYQVYRGLYPALQTQFERLSALGT
ncbi:MAG: xylulokinase [Chloroflexota bacterium]|nr:MAG: xylulokinase [Chloroflexota bacterium]